MERKSYKNYNEKICEKDHLKGSTFQLPGVPERTEKTEGKNFIQEILAELLHTHLAKKEPKCPAQWMKKFNLHTVSQKCQTSRTKKLS